MTLGVAKGGHPMNRSLKLKLAAGILSAASCQLYASSTLVVRVYNTSSASPRDLDEMKESASQVFMHSGIEIDWISCEPGPKEDSAVCPNPEGLVGRTVVFVRLVDAPVQPKHERNQFQRTLLGRANHHSSSVAIFYNTACAIEQNAPRVVTRGQILGHGVAHEMGHLLLGSDAHSLVGIMKENYDRDDLSAMGGGRLLFTAAESRSLRVRVSSVSASTRP
jgi:hypothetical protein